jgi:hypothetical protein
VQRAVSTHHPSHRPPSRSQPAGHTRRSLMTENRSLQKGRGVVSSVPPPGGQGAQRRGERDARCSSVPAARLQHEPIARARSLDVRAHVTARRQLRSRGPHGQARAESRRPVVALLGHAAGTGCTGVQRPMPCPDRCVSSSMVTS